MSRAKERGTVQPAFDRRCFLGAAGATAVAIGGTGCLSSADVGATLERLGVEDARELLSRLDALVETAPDRLISTLLEERGDLPPERERSQELAERLRWADRIARRLVVGLSVMGVFRELPADQGEEPEVREDLERHGAEVVEAMLEATHLVATCPREQLRAVEAALRDDPELALGLVGGLAADGRRQGLPGGARRVMRGLALEVNRAAREGELVALAARAASENERFAAAHGAPPAAIDWGLPSFWAEEPERGTAKERRELPERLSRNRGRGLVIAGTLLALFGGVVAITFAFTDSALCVSIPAAIVCLLGLILLFVGIGMS